MKFTQEFKPSRSMRAYAYQRAKLGEAVTEISIAEKIGIAPSTISNWKQLPGYHEWLASQTSHYRIPILELLEQVAIDRLPDDFRYWEAMAKKYGLITKDSAPTPSGDPGMRVTPAELVELVKNAREKQIPPGETH